LKALPADLKKGSDGERTLAVAFSSETPVLGSVNK